jgi:hypothetical protein
MPILQSVGSLAGYLLSRDVGRAAGRTSCMHHRWTLRRRMQWRADSVYVRNRGVREHHVQHHDEHEDRTHVQRRAMHQRADAVR